MLAEKLGQFVMRDRKNAIFLAVAFAIIPFLHWISAAIIALVTLRQGVREGFVVFIWSALPYVVMAFIGAWMPLISGVLLGTFVVLSTALMLRRFENWTIILECTAFFGILLVLSVHLFVPNVTGWWEQQIIKNAGDFVHLARLHMSAGKISQIAHIVACYATGLQIAVILFIDIMELMVGRYLQARLYNPGGFQKEWINLRIGVISMSIFVMIALLALFGVHVLKDVLPVLAMPFLLVGMSVVHGALYLFKISNAWIVSFYVLLFTAFVFMPIVLGLLILIALMDSVFDFRSRIRQ